MSIFQDVLVRKPGRSLFNLSHEKKFSCDWGYLYPILCTELVPGDTFKVNTEVFVRTAPLVAPIMHRVSVKLNYFFVPNRLLWDEWETFITGVDQSVAYEPTNPQGYFKTPVPPYLTLSSEEDYNYFKDGSLADFLGFPTLSPYDSADASDAVNVQVLPFRAYQKIYDDWFRNQNVEGSHLSFFGSGISNVQFSEVVPLRRRMWEKDYFTSALPFAQRGDPVQIPIADFEYTPGAVTKLTTYQGTELPDTANLKNLQAVKMEADRVEYDGIAVNTGVSQVPVNINNAGNLNINVGTINDLRLATRLQRWLEINSRVGGRYIEQILGHYGIKSSDARLQRSEYLGGFSSPIVVDAINQTSATLGDSQYGETTPQGNQAGAGTSYNKGKTIKCFAEEHGFLFGILSIIPRTSYQNGLPRMFQRNYKEDYYFPEFANLGEQEVNKAEVYFDLADSSKRTFERFGFQERFCEYKYIPSTVHGEFKNNLQFWHLGRDFAASQSQPALNKDFVECNPRTNIFAVESNVSHFYVNLINHVSAMRPMPRQAIPTL